MHSFDYRLQIKYSSWDSNLTRHNQQVTAVGHRGVASEWTFPGVFMPHYTTGMCLTADYNWKAKFFQSARSENQSNCIIIIVCIMKIKNTTTHTTSVSLELQPADPGLIIPPKCDGIHGAFWNRRMLPKSAICPRNAPGCFTPIRCHLFWLTAVAEFLCQSLTDGFGELRTRAVALMLRLLWQSQWHRGTQQKLTAFFPLVTWSVTEHSRFDLFMSPALVPVAPSTQPNHQRTIVSCCQSYGYTNI